VGAALLMTTDDAVDQGARAGRRRGGAAPWGSVPAARRARTSSGGASAEPVARSGPRPWSGPRPRPRPSPIPGPPLTRPGARHPAPKERRPAGPRGARCPPAGPGRAGRRSPACRPTAPTGSHGRRSGRAVRQTAATTFRPARRGCRRGTARRRRCVAGPRPLPRASQGGRQRAPEGSGQRSGRHAPRVAENLVPRAGGHDDACRERL